MSDADVESYKQIKSDLDVLRQSVEKSELWVYKSNKPAAAIDEHQQQQAQAQLSAAQVPTPANDDTPVTTASSTHSGDTVSSTPLSQKETTDDRPTISIPPTIPAGIEHADSVETDGGEEEDEEDDEYRKIQKVLITVIKFDFITNGWIL